ncbi:MAG: lactate utilization protein [Desulfuromonadales bacterium]|jgi:L-lactate dehydrogenase complex protein LldG|nr:lactate utilization protein [Desulfuromonadales bacterium]
MTDQAQYVAAFSTAAENVGSKVVSFPDLEQALIYLARHAGGAVMLPDFPSGQRHGLPERLQQQGLEVVSSHLREAGKTAAAGLTGVNFALADTGTLVLESTEEDIRLATTLPERHFALLDPRKILADSLVAVAPMRAMHQRASRNYVAYITGPSRTADIERVLTIGVHGPSELHILLVPGLSDDLLEM